MELIDTFDHYEIDKIHVFTLAEVTLHVHTCDCCSIIFVSLISPTRTIKRMFPLRAL